MVMISFLSHEIKDSGPTGSTPHPNFSGFWMRLVSETAKILSHRWPFFSKGQSQSRIDWRCGCTFKSLTREYTRNEAKPNPRLRVKKCADWARCVQSSRQSGGLQLFHTAHRLTQPTKVLVGWDHCPDRQSIPFKFLQARDRWSQATDEKKFLSAVTLCICPFVYAKHEWDSQSESDGGGKRSY